MMTKIAIVKHKLASTYLLLAALLAGCSLLPADAPTPTLPEPSSIYQTVAAQLTASAQPTQKTSTRPVVTVVLTQLATAFPTTPQPDTTQPPMQPSATPPCERAAPGRPSIDISVPDNTQFLPGQSFTKTWRLVNNGTCPWTRDYAAVWFSGEAMGPVRVQPFSSTVPPGQSVDITIDFIAPQAPGVYQSNWMIRNPSGKVFGLGPTSSGPFYVRIEVMVARTSTNTPLPTLTATPTLAIVARGSFTLNLEKKVDLDSGKLVTDATADLTLQGKPPAAPQLTPINGSVIALMGMQAPTLADCKAAALRNDPLILKADMAGAYVCYRTSQALPGIALLKTIDLKEPKVTLEFTTWAVP